MTPMDVDARVAPWARQMGSGVIPEERLPMRLRTPKDGDPVFTCDKTEVLQSNVHVTLSAYGEKLADNLPVVAGKRYRIVPVDM